MCASCHEKLGDLLNNLQHMMVLIKVAVSEAVAFLLESDLARVGAVISNGSQLDAMHKEPEYCCLSLLAPQTSVVDGLRTIISAIRVIFELARMDDLAVHVAKIVQLRFPDSAVPDSPRGNFPRMSKVCVVVTQLADQSLKDCDAVAALQMTEIDYEVDHLRRDRFGVLLGKGWSGSVEQAIDAALPGRYFERFTDHAVAVARRVIYIITGQFPEGGEWPSV